MIFDLLTRRDFLQLATAAGAATVVEGVDAQIAPNASNSPLKAAALRDGKILGCYIVMHDLLFPQNTAALASNFSMIADGNDLKFSNRLRPTPEDFDFTIADIAVAWAKSHDMLFRGHCLIWWNALPDWFAGYVTRDNARDVLTKHITTVVKHYAGKMYSWDVVNEPIHNENRPDMLRHKPWVDMIGPEYIDLAFHTAREADPKVRLVLNECYIEHATPAEAQRRDALLALLMRLKKSNVPVTTVGIQAHLRGAVPLDRPGLTSFMQQVSDAGFDIMITEMDVDDVNVPGPQIADTVASKYREFLDITLPFVKVITLEGLRNESSTPKRPDGFAHQPNIFDENTKPTPAYTAVLQELGSKR